METLKKDRQSVFLRSEDTVKKEKVVVNFTEITTEERNKIRLDAYDYIL